VYVLEPTKAVSDEEKKALKMRKITKRMIDDKSITAEFRGLSRL
jgi:hypothetical protein